MTAAVTEVIARLPDCDGKAADAVSAYTQVKVRDAPELLMIPKTQWRRHIWPKSWADIEDPVVLLGRNL